MCVYVRPVVTSVQPLPLHTPTFREVYLRKKKNCDWFDEGANTAQQEYGKKNAPPASVCRYSSTPTRGDIHLPVRSRA